MGFYFNVVIDFRSSDDKEKDDDDDNDDDDDSFAHCLSRPPQLRRHHNYNHKQNYAC